MNKPTKFFLLTGIALLVYGYMCRAFNIYFFWDSKSIGWTFLLIALIFFLLGLYKSRKHQGKKTMGVITGICLAVFAFFLLWFVVFMLKTSDAYQAAIEYLKTDAQVKELVGDVKGFGLIPTGAMQSTTVNGAESGNASFSITVRGTKKYKDVTLTLEKTPETFWQVVSIR